MSQNHNQNCFKASVIDFSAFAENRFDELTNLIEKSSQVVTNNLFVIVPNIVFRKFPLTTHICDFTDTLDLLLIDELIWLNHSETISCYDNLFKSVLWFSKKLDYDFNKDLLRVPHIWKEFEWGKRAKNYHELGKDMGNIWLKEFAEKTVTTKHEFYLAEELYGRLLVSQIKSETEVFAIYSTEKDILKVKIEETINEKIAFVPKIEIHEL